LSKNNVKIFVSYAHRNKAATTSFLEKLMDVCAPSKRYNFSFWRDNEIVLGEKWNSQIINALDESDVGLLMISPAFLSSIVSQLKNEL
jgi:hypothetical protein